MGDCAHKPVDRVAGQVVVVFAAFGGERLITEYLEVPRLEVLMAVPVIAAFESKPRRVVCPVASRIDPADPGRQVGEGKVFQIARRIGRFFVKETHGHRLGIGAAALLVCHGLC